jgi:hypothetical protein
MRGKQRPGHPPDCIEARFGVILISFTASSVNQNGSFTGYGPDNFKNGGNNATLGVTNDVSTYSTSQILNQRILDGYPPLPPGRNVVGMTRPDNPSVNFTANNLMQLGYDPGLFIRTQVHELGNSLGIYTRAANGDNKRGQDNDYGQKLENCVQKAGGFVNPRG